MARGSRKEYGRAYRHAHQEQIRACFRRWKAKNRKRYNEQKIISEHKRRASKKMRGVYTFEEWCLLKKIYNHTCPCCLTHESETKLTVDHIVPLSRGGLNVIDNIQPLCGPCNTKKGTRIAYYLPVTLS